MKKSKINKIKPLKSYREPGYPGKEFFAANPGRLLSYVPGAWVNKPLALGALLAFVCSGSLPAPARELLPTSTGQDEKLASNENTKTAAKTGAVEQKTTQQKQSVAVAPLFIHGTGTGAIGCIVMAPPVFLTEAEAIEIILTELKNAGFRFDTNDYIVPGVFTREVIEQYAGENREPMRQELDSQHPFYFDLYDKQHNVGIKFISEDNYFKLGGAMDSSSVQGYDFIDIAQKTREILMGQGKTNAAVFYDPLVKSEDYSRRTNDEALEKGTQELKEQVKDFIYWIEREVISKEAGTR